MKLKLDENLGNQGRHRLQAAGHDVATVHGQELCSATDQTLIEVCRIEKRALLSLDLDFANPVHFQPDHYAGIAVFRWPSSLGPEGLDRCLDTLIKGLEGSTLAGQLWIVEPERIRVYTPE